MPRGERRPCLDCRTICLLPLLDLNDCSLRARSLFSWYSSSELVISLATSPLLFSFFYLSSNAKKKEERRFQCSCRNCIYK